MSNKINIITFFLFSLFLLKENVYAEDLVHCEDAKEQSKCAVTKDGHECHWDNVQEHCTAS